MFPFLPMFLSGSSERVDKLLASKANRVNPQLHYEAEGVLANLVKINDAVAAFLHEQDSIPGLVHEGNTLTAQDYLRAVLEIPPH
jgi:hypothetical protein